MEPRKYTLVVCCKQQTLLMSCLGLRNFLELFFISLFDRITKLRSQRIFFLFFFIFFTHKIVVELRNYRKDYTLVQWYCTWLTTKRWGFEPQCRHFFPKVDDYFNAPYFLNVVNYFRAYYYFLWTTLKRIIISLSKLHCFMAPIPLFFPKGRRLL